MEVRHALRIVNNMIYIPGWAISASDLTHRFGSAIEVRVDYRAVNTNEVEAEQGYPHTLETYACEPVYVADFTDELDLFDAVEKVIDKIETHERREALRDGVSMIAPFHPHRPEGTDAWIRYHEGYTRDDDLKFGSSVS